MKKRRFLVLSLALVFALTLVFTNMVAAQPYGSDVSKQLSEVRQVTTKYHDINEALEDGYETDYHVVRHMGIHLVNGDLLGDKMLEPLNPEVLVYEPRKNGGYRLVAVEYLTVAVDERPSLFGQEFDNGPFDDSFALHAWIWQANPDGMFTPYNRKVTKTE